MTNSGTAGARSWLFDALPSRFYAGFFAAGCRMRNALWG
jgi:hypothetical protein